MWVDVVSAWVGVSQGELVDAVARIAKEKSDETRRGARVREKEEGKEERGKGESGGSKGKGGEESR